MAIPNITVFVRHSADCEHRGDGEFYRQCRCRKHLRWYRDGKLQRLPALTRSWSLAEQRKREIEDTFRPEPGRRMQERVTLAAARDSFLAHKKSEVQDTSKYQKEIDYLITWAEKRLIIHTDELTTPVMTEFQLTWEERWPSKQTRQIIRTHYNAFFNYCKECRWLVDVPKLARIRITQLEREKNYQKLPLSASEYTRVLDAIPSVFSNATAGKMRGIIQAMRWVASSLTDTMLLRRDKMYKGKDGKWRVEYRRKKTGRLCIVPIPDDAANDISVAAEMNPSDIYLFWNPKGDEVLSSVKRITMYLATIFKAAKVRATSHILRHTFAHYYLRKGVPVETVAAMMGDSMAVLLRHYHGIIDETRRSQDAKLIAAWT